MFIFKILQENDAPLWDDYIYQHPHGTIYHTYLWQKVIAEAYNHQPLYLFAVEENHHINAAIPLFIVQSRVTGKRLTSLPCAQYCNPLIGNQVLFDAAIEYLLRFAEQENCKYIELKTKNDFEINTTKFGSASLGYSTYSLDLNESIKKIEKNLHKSCIRRVIKKSYRNNLELVIGKSEKDLKTFYKLYLNMRKQHGLLAQPYIFFSALWRTLYPHRYIDIFLCKYKGQIVSAILILKYKDTVIYEYGASQPAMLKYGVSHFLLWEAIRYAKDHGYGTFDFGRTADDNTGLTEFKSRWGAKRHGLTYYFIPKIENFALYRKKTIVNKLMNFTITALPAPANQIIGRALYKHIV